MLRWERTWSLRKIDASTDPNTEDSSVHEQHAQHAQPGRVIVGHCGAKQTVLLLADTSAAAETRIWTVEDLNDIDKPCYERSVIEPLKTKRTPPSKTNRRPLLKEIYQHHSNATIVHASVNTKHTLLAFTTFTSLSHPPLYETFLAEIQPQQRVFSLGSATAQRQRVHFIVDEDDDDDDDNDESQGNVVDQVESACDKRATSVDVTTSRLLFLLDRQYIQTYAIDVRRSSSSSSPGKVAVAYTIDGQPRKERTIARKHLWSTWDPYQSIVHVVRRREDLTAGSRMSTTSVSSLGSASSLTVSATPLDLVLTSVALLSPVDVSANVQAADVTSEGKAIPIPRTDSASSLDVGRAFGTAAVESPLSPGGSQSSILVNSSLWPSPARRRRRPVALGNSSAASDSTAGTHSSQSQTTDMPLPFDEDGLSSQLAALLTAELLPPCIDPLSHATFANAHSSMRVLHFDNNITCLILWWKGDQMQPVQFALWWWRKDEQTVVVRLQFDVAAEKFQDVLVGMASMDGWCQGGEIIIVTDL